MNIGTCSFILKDPFMKMKTCIYKDREQEMLKKTTEIPAYKYINSTLSTLIFKHCRIFFLKTKKTVVI